MTKPRHSFGEHIGEIELRVEAESLAALFEEAARALAELLAEDASGPTAGPPTRVGVTSTDREALLVDWLNELIYRGEVDKCIFADVRIEHIDDHSLEAQVRARLPEAPRTAVKAATWHGTCVRANDGRFEARVVLDV